MWQACMGQSPLTAELQESLVGVQDTARTGDERDRAKSRHEFLSEHWNSEGEAWLNGLAKGMKSWYWPFNRLWGEDPEERMELIIKWLRVKAKRGDDTEYDDCICGPALPYVIGAQSVLWTFYLAYPVAFFLFKGQTCTQWQKSAEGFRTLDDSQGAAMKHMMFPAGGFVLGKWDWLYLLAVVLITILEIGAALWVWAPKALVVGPLFEAPGFYKKILSKLGRKQESAMDGIIWYAIISILLKTDIFTVANFCGRAFTTMSCAEHIGEDPYKYIDPIWSYSMKTSAIFAWMPLSLPYFIILAGLTMTIQPVYAWAHGIPVECVEGKYPWGPKNLRWRSPGWSYRIMMCGKKQTHGRSVQCFADTTRMFLLNQGDEEYVHAIYKRSMKAKPRMLNHIQRSNYRFLIFLFQSLMTMKLQCTVLGIEKVLNGPTVNSIDEWNDLWKLLWNQTDWTQVRSITISALCCAYYIYSEVSMGKENFKIYAAEAIDDNKYFACDTEWIDKEKEKDRLGRIRMKFRHVVHPRFVRYLLAFFGFFLLFYIAWNMICAAWRCPCGIYNFSPFFWRHYSGCVNINKDKIISDEWAQVDCGVPIQFLPSR